jgi:RNA polymerase sigma-70 factor (ECF subfamily)
MGASIHAEVCKSLPFIRGYAMSLARNRAMGEDVAQTAMLRALIHAHRFEPGTNFRAWIATIVRNCYCNELRAASRAPTSQLSDLHAPVVSGGQEERITFLELCRSLKVLTSVQRQALLMVGVDGLSYEDAARRADCATGTMKSRVSRARDRLRATERR